MVNGDVSVSQDEKALEICCTENMNLLNVLTCVIVNKDDKFYLISILRVKSLRSGMNSCPMSPSLLLFVHK